jgi:hypothetical protein
LAKFISVDTDEWIAKTQRNASITNFEPLKNASKEDGQTHGTQTLKPMADLPFNMGKTNMNLLSSRMGV